jgi:hypothetical protein
LFSMLTALAAWAQSSGGANGIQVSSLKVYDDYYLEQQLATLKSQLGGLSVLDSGTLLSKIGAIQGGSNQGSGFALQGAGPGTAQTTTTTLPTSQSAALAGGATTAPLGTTVTGPSLTPSAPAAAQPTLTLPSTLTPSGLDALNEEMQLSSQILNLQLLLDGALNDRFNTGSQTMKRRVTVGFSINIDPPDSMKKNLKGALAEVEITIGGTPQKPDQQPSIITLLPREKTYNVVGMVQHSLSIGAGAILAGVVNLGASWGWWKQKAYVYQQQDTLALQESDSKFKWQFRPVLDRDFVQPGTRQTFMQISLAIPAKDERFDCSAMLHVRVGWRKIDSKTGIPSAMYVDPQNDAGFDLPVPYYEINPITKTVDVKDIGNGQVLVTASGELIKDGLSVRVGNAILNQSTPNFAAYDGLVTFVAQAQDLITGGASLILRDGKENAIQAGLNQVALKSCSGQKAPELIKSSDESKFELEIASIDPYSDSQARVRLKLKNKTTGPFSANNPLVVVIGSQVFGLQNTPFLNFNTDVIEFLAPVDLLKSNQEIVVQQLLGTPQSRASKLIPMDKYPKLVFAVSGASIVGGSDPINVLVSGSGLKDATLIDNTVARVPLKTDPPPAATPTRQRCLTIADNTHDTYLVLNMAKACADQTKEFLLAKDANLPLTVTMPALKADPPKAVDPLSGTVVPGATSVVIKGTGLDQVALVEFEKTKLGFTLNTDKTLTIALPAALTAAECIRVLDIELADGSKLRYTLTVQKKKP